MAHNHDHSEYIDAKGPAERLKKARISVTQTRIKILELLNNSHRVWSIEQLISALKKLPKITRGSLVFTTVYRCLLKMEESKLVKRVDLGDGISRYEYDSGSPEHHHHIICRSCESIEPLDDCGIEVIENAVKKLGYSQIKHELQFFGICKPCTKKAA